MKRDLQIVEQILGQIEDQPLDPPDIFSVPGVDDGVLAYHLGLLEDGGLITCKAAGRSRKYQMTWDGHDYLDEMRSNSLASRFPPV